MWPNDCYRLHMQVIQTFGSNIDLQISLIQMDKQSDQSRWSIKILNITKNIEFVKKHPLDTILTSNGGMVYSGQFTAQNIYNEYHE